MIDAAKQISRPPLVQVDGIAKRFGGTLALAGVSFEVASGETVGLLGSNGAGKSTLIRILSGLMNPTSGQIRIEGVAQSISNPIQARDSGIVTVHQNIDDGVAFGMTVAENLLLDRMSGDGAAMWMPYGSVRRQAKAMLEELGFDLPLDALVEDIPASSRQEISIARALIKTPKLLILDEPTSTLSARESERLFERVAGMQAAGISVLYVSHRMSDIERLCDRAVVLRNGQVVSSHVAPLNLTDITQSILGELALTGVRPSRLPGETIFSARGMRAKPHRAPIDLDVRRGEIVGVTGLVGAGKTELLEQISGARPLVSGRMAIRGEAFQPRDQAHALGRGIAMIPEERAAQSIFPGETVANHASIGRLERFTSLGFMQRSRELAFAKGIIDQFRVRCPGPAAAIEALSGGNQQKLLVGRWLADDRALVILDEPFRGIDIGARGIIADALRKYSENTGVIVCSSDPEEVIEVADRVIVLLDGAIVCNAPSSELSADGLAEIMSGSHQPNIHTVIADAEICNVH